MDISFAANFISKATKIKKNKKIKNKQTYSFGFKKHFRVPGHNKVLLVNEVDIWITILNNTGSKKG